MFERKSVDKAVVGLMAAGAAWPSVYGAISYALASPLERALLSAWCGGGSHGIGLAMLGHCVNCWAGAAAFLAAAALLAMANRRPVRTGAA